MSEKLEPAGIELDVSQPKVDEEIAGFTGRVTLLEALSEPAIFVSPNMSNRSTPPTNTDFDDH